MTSSQGIVHNYVKALNLKHTPEGFDYAAYFPEYFAGGDKVNILFINARTDVHSWHRMIIPGITWARNGKKVATCITNIENVKKDLNYTTVDFDIPEELISRSDILFIPFSAEHPGDEVAYMLIHFMRYARNLNPGIKIVFSVEWDFYSIPECHDAHSYFTEEMIGIAEDNIIHADYVFVPTAAMAHKIIDKVRDRVLGEGPTFLVYNYFISDIELEGTSALHDRTLKKTPGRKRIGIIMNHFDRDDFRAFRDVFLAAQKKYGNKLEFVVWGNALDVDDPDIEKKTKGIGQLVEMKTVSPSISGGLKHRRFKFDNHLYHLKNLFNLDFDAVYFLKEDTEWNRNNGLPQAILDCMMLDIPVFTNLEYENFDKGLVNFLPDEAAIEKSFDDIVTRYEPLKMAAEDVRRGWLARARMLSESVSDEMEAVYYNMKHPK